MNLKLNRYRLVQLIILLATLTPILWQGMHYENCMFYMNVSMYSCMLLILLCCNIASIKFILSFLLFSIALVPGAAYYLMGFKLYSYVNFEHQLNDDVTAYTLMLFYLSFNIYTYLILFKDKLNYVAKPVQYSSRIPYFFLAIMVLVTTYFTESGSTIITSDYAGIMEERSALMTLAGVALAAFYADFYAKYRMAIVDKNKFRIWLFWIITGISIMWLVLHARRTEPIGFLALFIIHQRMILGKTPYKMLFYGTLFLFILYFIGYTRVGAMTEIDVLSEVKRSLSLTFESGARKVEFANMPSGLGNITETMQTTVYHFIEAGNEFLNGKTIFSYPYKLIPNNVIELLGLPSLKDYNYNSLVLQEYYYQGGTFILAPAFGNFGILGIIVSSIFFACLVIWTQKAFYSNSFHKIAIATIVIFLFIKMTWYGPLPMVKAVFYNLIFLGMIALMFPSRNKLVPS